MRYFVIALTVVVAVSVLADYENLSPEELEAELKDSIMNKDTEKREEIITIIEEKYPTDPDLVELILPSYLYGGEVEKYHSAIDRMISEYPEEYKWLLYKAFAIYNVNDPSTYEKTENLLKKAEELSPDNPELLYKHGFFKYELGELESAKKLLEKCLKLDEEKNVLNDEITSTILYNLGSIYALEDDPETSFDYLTRAFALSPSFIQKSLLDPNLKTLKEYQPFLEFMGEYEDASLEGKIAPEFKLKGLDGNQYRLTDYRDRVVLLNFWATWSKPCINEIPDISALYNDYKDNGLVVIGISLDSKSSLDDEELKAKCEELGIDYTILRSDEATIENYIDPSGGLIPQTYIIDRDGIITDAIAGERDSETFEEMIEPYL